MSSTARCARQRASSHSRSSSSTAYACASSAPILALAAGGKLSVIVAASLSIRRPMITSPSEPISVAASDLRLLSNIRATPPMTGSRMLSASLRANAQCESAIARSPTALHTRLATMEVSPNSDPSRSFSRLSPVFRNRAETVSRCASMGPRSAPGATLWRWPASRRVTSTRLVIACSDIRCDRRYAPICSQSNGMSKSTASDSAPR